MAARARLVPLRAASTLQCTRPARRFSSLQPKAFLPRLAVTARSTYPPFQPQRPHSRLTESERAGIYGYEDVLGIVENPSSAALLVDVREPYEFDANAIPNARNLPVRSEPDALLLEPKDFLDRFGWQKPPLDHELVFYCKAGVRSSSAAAFARQVGYTNVKEYRGSWLDWERNGGPGTKGSAK